MRSFEFAPGTSITLAQAEEVLEFLKQYDSRASLIADYSGKFMYGEKCLAYATSTPAMVGTAFTLVLSKIASGIEGIMDSVSTSREDSLGLGFVVYFPYLPVEG